MPLTHEDDAQYVLMKDIADHDIPALRMPDFDSSTPRYRIYYQDSQDKLLPSLSFSVRDSYPVGTVLPILSDYGRRGAMFVNVTMRLISRRDPRRNPYENAYLTTDDALNAHHDLWHRIFCRIITLPSHHDPPVQPYPEFQTHLAAGPMSIQVLENRFTTISDNYKYQEGFIFAPSSATSDQFFGIHPTAYETFQTYSIMPDPA